MGLRICSYNVGMGAADLSARDRRFHWVPTKEDMANPTQVTYIKDDSGNPITHYVDPERYSRTEEKTAEFVAKKADAFCLQEVQNSRNVKDRALIQKLVAKNFTYLMRPRFNAEGKQNRRVDNVIALSKDRFTEFKNHSQVIEIAGEGVDREGNMIPAFKKDVAIATARDKNTKEVSAFVSVHVPGFDFRLNGDELSQEAEKGDIYCRKVLDQLVEVEKKTQGLSQIIIGGDFNANPEKWPDRFKIFEEHGYRIVRSGMPTAVYARNEESSEREIDFFLVRQLKTTEKQVHGTCLENLENTSHEKNSSDHVPIMLEIDRPKKTNAQIVGQQEPEFPQSPKPSQKPRPSQEPRPSFRTRPNVRSNQQDPANLPIRTRRANAARVRPVKKRPFFLKRIFRKVINWIRSILNIGSKKG